MLAINVDPTVNQETINSRYLGVYGLYIKLALH